MKILLRKHGDKNYQWVEATYKDCTFFVDGVNIIETNIVSITDDDRERYVKCNACGKIMKKDSDEVEVHRNKWRDIETCFNCRYLHTYKIGSENIKYEKGDDGEYRRTIKERVTLSCRSTSYWNPDAITDDSDRNFCRYRACNTAEMTELSDIFFDSPGIFDDIITVDKIFEAGYKASHASAHRGYYIDYVLKGRNNIHAVTNAEGIVDFFFFKYRNKYWRITYSKKLDKLYGIDSATYYEWNPADINESTKAYVKKKISELYN